MCIKPLWNRVYKGGTGMNGKFKSNFAQYIEGMKREKYNSGFSLKYMDKHLDEFDCFCRNYFPDKDLLDKELVEAWVYRTVLLLSYFVQ